MLDRMESKFEVMKCKWVFSKHFVCYLLLNQKFWSYFRSFIKFYHVSHFLKYKNWVLLSSNMEFRSINDEKNKYLMIKSVETLNLRAIFWLNAKQNRLRWSGLGMKLRKKVHKYDRIFAQ